jgi:hypothetical protein
MIIDGHAHSCGRFRTLANLIQTLDELNVDRIALCPGTSNSTNESKFLKIFKGHSKLITNPRNLMRGNRLLRLFSNESNSLHQANKHVYNYKKQYPKRIIQFYWVNPNDQQCIRQLEKALKEWAFEGIKLHQCINRFKIDSPGVEKLVHWADKKSLPIFIHSYSNREFKKLFQLIENYPGVNFISAHLIGLEVTLKEKNNINNLYFDLSPYYIISNKRIYKAIEHLSYERLLLGSDSPFGKENLKRNIQKIKNLKISNKAREAILGLNFLRILNEQ